MWRSRNAGDNLNSYPRHFSTQNNLRIYIMTTAYDYVSKFNAKSWTNINRKPKRIMIHHWGIDGQSHSGIRNFFVNVAKTSAHYVVSSGLVTCLVAPGKVAWHAGVWARNLTDIGIECRPEMSAGDFETAAQVIADLRKVYGNLPLVKHSDVRNTACPGRWANQLSKLSARANNINRGIPAPSKSTVHTVKRGDTTWAIANRYNTTVAKIGMFNKNVNVSKIYPGMKLRVK